MPESSVRVDVSNWSGEGQFTQVLIDPLQALDTIAFVRVEDAPASRSEADYNFISNELFVAFTVREHKEPVTRFGFLPGSRTITTKAMTLAELEVALGAAPEIGAADYSDDGMLQYL